MPDRQRINVINNLKLSFAEWKRPFLESHSFQQVINCFLRFLTCTKDEKEDARSELELYYDNFNHMCLTHPDAESHIKAYEEKMEKKKKSILHKKLYENHLELTKGPQT